MRLVEVAAVRPSRCAVLPQVGGSHPRGYVDTGSELLGGGDGRFDQHVYVSVVAVEEMARLVGWVHPGELEAQVELLNDELVKTRAELVDANRSLDAIDALESAGYKARKRPGRKPQPPVREEQPA